MVKILHVYYDILNLYGENGNIRVLERRLKDMGAQVEITRKTITDKEICFTDYDFIYCGCGTESNRDACLKHLIKFKSSFTEAFNENKVMLFTGNAYEMLGKILINGDKQDIEGMGIFDFKVSEQKNVRYSGDIVGTVEGFDKPFVGFINKCSTVMGNTKPMIKINRIIGTVKDEFDGVVLNNFYGTQLIGPILARNPHFAKHIAKLLYPLGQDVNYEYCEKGYEVTLSELTKEK